MSDPSSTVLIASNVIIAASTIAATYLTARIQLRNTEETLKVELGKAKLEANIKAMELVASKQSEADIIKSDGLMSIVKYCKEAQHEANRTIVHIRTYLQNPVENQKGERSLRHVEMHKRGKEIEAIAEFYCPSAAPHIRSLIGDLECVWAYSDPEFRNDTGYLDNFEKFSEHCDAAYKAAKSAIKEAMSEFKQMPFLGERIDLPEPHP